MRPTILASLLALVALPAVPAWADCKTDLAGVIARVSQAGPYHVEMITDTSGEPVSKLTGDYDGGGAAHLLTDSNGTKSEVVIIAGKGAWLRLDSPWEFVPPARLAPFEHLLRSVFPTFVPPGITCLPEATATRIAFAAPGRLPGVHAEIELDSSGLPARYNLFTLGTTGVATFTFNNTIAISPPQ